MKLFERCHGFGCPLVAIALLFAGTPARAGIDTKNANYTQTWLDAQMTGGGFDLKIERTYNSRSLYNGMFGFGWCSNFETRLDQTAEGTVKTSECGAGQEISFLPKEANSKDRDATVGKILAKLKEMNKVPEAKIKELEKELGKDDDLRASYARELKIAIPVKDGTWFYANGKEVDVIFYEKGVYTRTLPDGTKMKFNQQGRLTHLYDKNANYIKFDYEKDQITGAQDNSGKRFSFKYHTNKKVKTVTAPGGVTLEYTYANLDDLATVKNMWANNYGYEYDELHNLTKASYPDGTSIGLKYDKKNDWVVQFTDRDKCVEDYTYEFDPKTPTLKYWSNLVKTCGKEVTNRSRFEFWFKERPDGQTVLSRVATTVNGDVTEIAYHEVFGKPVVVRRGNLAYEFDYFPNGQVKEKKGPGTKLVYQYDTKSRKVSEVTTQVLDTKGKATGAKKTSFKYDDKGNLTFATNSDGQTIEMSYDDKGRIDTIKDHAKKVVRIQYDERFGRPAVLSRPGLGTVQVSFKANGEIEKVDSKEGPIVAKQVVSTFSNLLEVISPANAEMYN